MKIGIDRIKLIIFDVGIERSKYKFNIEIGEKAEVMDIETGEVIKVSDFNVHLKGTALKGDDYRVKLSLDKRNGYQFILDVNVPKLLYNTNEMNVNDLEHLSQVNEIIEKVLADEHIYIDMSKARICSIEMNVNSTDAKVLDAFKLLKRGMLNASDKVFSVENKRNIESLMIQNSYVKIKVYDKVQQLRDTGQLVNNRSLVRLEVSTKDTRAIHRLTGYTSTIDGLIDNWDNMKQWFVQQLNAKIKQPCEEFNNEVVSEMVEQLKQGNKTYSVLNGQTQKGNLIDFALFDRAVKQYYKETGKKSPYNIIKNAEKRLEKVLGVELMQQSKGNIQAIENLFGELGL